MKHTLKVTVILIAMFLITQLIGIAVFSAYINGIDLPYGMEPPKEIQEKPQGLQIIAAFIIAITLFFLLTKLNAETFIRIWYFTVTILAIGLALNVFLFKLNLTYASFLALIIAIPLAYIKIFKVNLLIHNLTELLIYPGIAAVFIPLLNVMWIIIILFLISLYDIWAVWHTEFMQKMAKYQIDKLHFFTGFFVPYAGKEERLKIKQLKEKYEKRGEKVLESQFKKAKIKINLAILGGGDVVFPIITAGIFYKFFGIIPALIIAGSSIIALFLLFILARKGKFYPAMPFLTIGMYLGMMVSWLVV